LENVRAHFRAVSVLQQFPHGEVEFDDVDAAE